MKLSDKELVEQLLSGNKTVLKRFYLEYSPRLARFVRLKVSNKQDAEEIVQDTFVSLLEALPAFGYRSSLWTFMISIAKHEVLDYYRKKYAKKAIKYVPFVDHFYSEPLYSASETREVFEQALHKLKEEERNLLLWKYEEKLSVEEIAEKLGVKIKAAESRLFRARQAFKVAYAEVVSEE